MKGMNIQKLVLFQAVLLPWLRGRKGVNEFITEIDMSDPCPELKDCRVTIISGAGLIVIVHGDDLVVIPMQACIGIGKATELYGSPSPLRSH